MLTVCEGCEDKGEEDGAFTGKPDLARVQNYHINDVPKPRGSNICKISRPVLVTAAKAYRKTSALAYACGTQTLQIGIVLHRAAINRLPYQGHTDVFIFEVTNYHSLFQHLKHRELSQPALPTNDLYPC